MEFLSTYWQVFLGQFLLGLPIFAVYFVGLVISLVKYKTQPRIALLSGIGFGILLLTSFASILFTVFTVHSFSLGYSAQTTAYLNAIVGFVMSLIRVAATGLLIAAIWKARA